MFNKGAVCWFILYDLSTQSMILNCAIEGVVIVINKYILLNEVFICSTFAKYVSRRKCRQKLILVINQLNAQILVL